MKFKIIAERILTRVQAKLAGLTIKDLNIIETMADRLATVNQTVKPIKSEVTPTKISARDVLATMGTAFDIRHENGLETKAVVLKVADLLEGINVEQMFPIKTVVKNGHLVNLSLREQIQLVKAITKAKPELAGQIGFYNLIGSLAVFKALNATNLFSQNDIWWFWTGEKYQGRDIADYPKANIVLPEKLNSDFCYRGIDLGIWSDDYPDNHDDFCAVVLGAK